MDQVHSRMNILPTAVPAVFLLFLETHHELHHIVDICQMGA
jgi:hypothetical protein